MPSNTAQIALIVLYSYISLEVLWLVLSKRAPFRSDFSQPLKNLVLVAVAGGLLARALPVTGAVALATLAENIAPFTFELEWYTWVIGLLVYEFWYWVQHFLAHKVRLFWCIHSPHHAPPTINMLVGTNHHFMEVLIWFPLFLGFLPALSGIPVAVIAVWSVTDVVWGSLLHISPQVIKHRYGPLEYILQTPAYHRVHHGKNLCYMDRNYNSITLFWDWVFRTRQPLLDNQAVAYGITREVNPESLRDVQFGEFSALWRDVRSAPGWRAKLGYMFHAPGWSHSGDNKTVTVQQRAAQESGYR